MRYLRKFHVAKDSVETVIEISDKDVRDFKPVALYKGELYEFVSYDRNKDGYDAVMDYCHIPSYSVGMHLDYEIIYDSTFGKSSCDCGGAKTDGGHSHWCSTKNS